MSASTASLIMIGLASATNLAATSRMILRVSCNLRAYSLAGVSAGFHRYCSALHSIVQCVVGCVLEDVECDGIG